MPRKVADLGYRIPEHGRIRFGVKGERGRPIAIDKFRFTSHDLDAITALAKLYGGEPKPWSARNEDQWEVLTQAKKIRVVLPPDPLGDTPIYELWSGGGLLRRCDGEACVLPRMTPDGAEMVETECVCVQQETMECKPKTRLSVVLPDIPFGGTWRLESGGWNAAAELPGMVEMIQALQHQGFVVAYLSLKREVTVAHGKTSRFIVPKLSVEQTPMELASGQGTLRALAAPPQEPLPSTILELDDQDTDLEVEDVIEAEIVEAEVVPISGEVRRLQRQMFALLSECGFDEEMRHAFANRASKGRTRSSSELTEDELTVVVRTLKLISEGQGRVSGVTEEGWIRVVPT